MSKFNFNIDNIDIEDNKIQDSLSKSKYNSISLKQLYLDLYVVDLGLPSKTIWCKYNLGVDIYKLSKPEDWFGNYYAWGELETKNEYSWITYKYVNKKYGKETLTKYYCNNNLNSCKNTNEYLEKLLLEDDAAYLNMHLFNYKFRMPTKDLFIELLEYTDSEWIKNYNDINKLNGRIFTSKTNNKKLFIPAAGYRGISDLNVTGISALLWSSSLYLDFPWRAYYLGFNPTSCGVVNYDRYQGYPIRPIVFKTK